MEIAHVEIPISIYLFQIARKTDMAPDIRYWVYERLLARKEISAEEVSKALVDTMKADDLGDMSFPCLHSSHWPRTRKQPKDTRMSYTTSRLVQIKL